MSPSMEPTSNSPNTLPQSIYQHPLAFLLGLEGIALMKAFAGEFDHDFTKARLREIRSLLESAQVLGDGAHVLPMEPADAYDGWAPTYDSPENGIFVIEETYIRPILDAIPVGDAIDMACGTGQHAAYLAGLGHDVKGFDVSERMLTRAREKLPGARFERADIRHLPAHDASADAIVCALALSHTEDLEPVFAEAVRVLRPGGRFIISDTRGHFVGSSLYPLIKQDVAGNIGYIPNWRHSTVDYLRAALPLGFRVRDVQEPQRQARIVDPATPPPPIEDCDRPPNIWALHHWAVDAANAASRDDPVLIIWDFELDA